MTTLYEKTEQGGMSFTSTRRPGEVRIPNYVYDLWMPLLGIEAIGVYAVYCRLEREGIVKSMSQQRLVQEMRIGVGKLNKINDLLNRYGFIDIHKPESFEKLMHFTIEITVHDPPRTIPAETIAELKHPKGYEVLCPWLKAKAPNQIPNGHAGDTNESCANHSDGNANVAPSCVAPLVVEEEPALPVSPPADDSWPGGTETKPVQRKGENYLQEMRDRHGDNPLAVMANSAAAQEREGRWTDPSFDLDPWVDVYESFAEAFIPGAVLGGDPTRHQKRAVKHIQELAVEVGACPRHSAQVMRPLAALEGWMVGPSASPHNKRWEEAFQNALRIDIDVLKEQAIAKMQKTARKGGSSGPRQEVNAGGFRPVPQGGAR